MKKFMLPAIVAIAAASGIIGFSNQSSKHELNALAIANIEALTLTEVQGGCITFKGDECFFNGLQFTDSKAEYYFIED